MLALAFLVDVLRDRGSLRQGNNLLVFVECDSQPEAERVFAALAEKGSITLPLQKTFFSASFGMLVDRFGVHWKISTSD